MYVNTYGPYFHNSWVMRTVLVIGEITLVLLEWGLVFSVEWRKSNTKATEQACQERRKCL